MFHMWYTDFPRPRPLHFNYFSPFSFAVTVGNIINVLSHTPSSLHFPRFRKARQPVFHLSFNSWPLYSFFCLFGVFFFQLCERMLGWLEGKDLVSQVAVGGQICWQSDRLTHLGHCSSVLSFPPHCIPAQTSDTDPLKHPQAKIGVV